MSNKYKHGDHVPTEVLADRLKELSKVVTQGPEAVTREFTMRVPAERDRDADLVMAEAARRLRELSQPAEQEQTCRWRRLYGCDTPKNHVLYTDGHGEDHEFYQRRPETCGDCGGKIVEESIHE